MYVASVSNYSLFYFFILNLTAHLNKKFAANIIFYCGLFYQYEFFKNDLNLTMFV